MLNKMYAMVSVVVICIIQVSSSKVCDGSKNVEWRADPSDCTVFYLCFGTLQHEYRCEKNQVYNEEAQKCVPIGSEKDKCTKRKTNPIHPNQKADCSSVFLPHEESCSKYFDCILNSVQECPYPLLFDEDIKRCVPPKKANCGTRTVYKDPCDYIENDCRSSMGCVPCHVRYPSCKGLPDGLNPWAGREESPYFAVCSNERVVYHDMCDYENKNEIFNPEKLACESIYK